MSVRKKNGIGSFLFGFTARTLMIASALLLVFSYLSMYINPAKTWFMAIPGILYFPIFILNVILFLWAARRRSRTVVIPFLALLPSIFLFGRYLQFNGGDYVPSPDDIKLVSYNVGKFASSHKGTYAPEVCADSIFAFLLEQDADIISLQEIRTKGNMKTFCESRMPGYKVVYYADVDKRGAYGNAILSRLPITGKGKFNFENSGNHVVYADFEAYGRRFRVYNCHLESYNVSIPGFVKSLTREDHSYAQEAESRVIRSLVKRQGQVSIVVGDIKESPVESIVMGDFNDTPVSYTYTMLRKNRKDSFAEAGRGMGGTYSVLWPFIRIDYILVPDKYEISRHEVKRKAFSDHYPIISTIHYEED